MRPKKRKDERERSHSQKLIVETKEAVEGLSPKKKTDKRGHKSSKSIERDERAQAEGPKISTSSEFEPTPFEGLQGKPRAGSEQKNVPMICCLRADELLTISTKGPWVNQGRRPAGTG